MNRKLYKMARPADDPHLHDTGDARGFKVTDVTEYEDLPAAVEGVS
jgi:hypothetical protein